MIRGTKNEGISSQAKDKTVQPSVGYAGMLSEGIELVNTIASDVIVESSEATVVDSSLLSTLPSSEFNGTFE